MNVAIVDDDPKEIEIISAVIKEYSTAGRLNITLQAFHRAEDLLKNYHPYAYTAIFMDVYMDGMSGVSAAREILSKDRRAIIIFLTSSNEHMPEAFSLHVYDYIIKPAQKERLFQVMDDVMQKVTALSTAPGLTFTHDRRDICIPYPDVVLVQTVGRNYLEIVDASGETYRTRLTFSEVSRRLSEDHRFLPILRGILINMDYIRLFEQEICELEGGMRLSVNVKNAKELKATWQNYKLDSIRLERRQRREHR